MTRTPPLRRTVRRATTPRRAPVSEQPSSLLQLHIALADIEPLIWRRLIVHDAITLPQLHRVFQATMGWSNSHLHEFDIAGNTYGEPDPTWQSSNDVLAERQFTLADCLRGHTAFGYRYDFGDEWRHRVTIETTLPQQASRYLLCVAGANACPPEDVGGPHGYANYLAAIADPTHEDHDELIEWLGYALDPKDFSVNLANQRLQQIKLSSAATRREPAS